MSVPPDRTSRRIATSRVARRPPRLSAVLMALSLLFFLGYVFFLRTPPEMPVPDLSSVRGTYRWSSERQTADGGETIVQTGAFSAVASGNAGGSASGGAGETAAGATGASLPATDSVYDAAARRRSDRAGDEGGWRYQTTTGEWPPFCRLATRSPLDYQGLSAVLRSALEDDDRTVGTKVVDDGGRRAWRAAMTFAGEDLVELVVDQESGLVTWCAETTPRSSEVFTFTADWANPPAADATYELGAAGTAGAATVARDTAWTYVPALADVRALTGWDPLGSDLAPDGYAQRAVAVSAAGLRLTGQLVNDSLDAPPTSPDEDLVAQLYTRGLASFTVEQYGPKATRFYEDTVGSILENAAAEELSFARETLQYGWFKGLTAYTWYEKTGPTLFVAGRHRMVYITGSLTRQELVSFAQGLEPLS